MAHDLSDFRVDPGEHDPPPRRKGGGAIAFGVLVAAAVFGWFWWTHEAPQQPRSSIAVAPTDAPAPAPAATEPTVKYPLEEEPDTRPLKAGEIPASLAALVGRTAAATYLQTDQFPRRVVSTLDNLGRAHAPPASWPVMATPGRFTVDKRSGTAVIAAENAERYTPFVNMVSSIDAKRAVALYRRMYPLLQQAWREQGMGNRYLNDRVVEVIDVLLATPVPAAPPQVRLTEVKGPIPSERPWVRYQFADEALEGLTAGQKILVRMGPEHERRLKKKLAEFRRELVQQRPGAPAR